MKIILTNDGRRIPFGQPFTNNGLQYPRNWGELATQEDLTEHGFTVEDLPDPPAAEQPQAQAQHVIFQAQPAAPLIDQAAIASDASEAARRQVRLYNEAMQAVDDATPTVEEYPILAVLADLTNTSARQAWIDAANKVIASEHAWAQSAANAIKGS